MKLDRYLIKEYLACKKYVNYALTFKNKNHSYNNKKINSF